ncbi:MAG: hypothetical protein K9J46_18430 [Saprospiraceae bacterium]|nr:hypothetical protein [Saprospiraceae bacterium]MCF8282339.1 hypothetical protein [Bacteroidales bacterium]
MEILWIVLKFIVANILLVIVSSTLIGIIVRGILQPRTKPTHGNHEAEYYSISPTYGKILSLGSFVFSIFLLVILYYYGNIYLVIGLISWMLARIKDLIREIKTGIKTTNKSMTKDSLDFILTATNWIGLGVFNYGLYLLWIK